MRAKNRKFNDAERLALIAGRNAVATMAFDCFGSALYFMARGGFDAIKSSLQTCESRTDQALSLAALLDEAYAHEIALVTRKIRRAS